MHAAPDQIVDSLPGTISIHMLSRNANQALLHRPALGDEAHALVGGSQVLEKAQTLSSLVR